jgi:CubicO group peptidase (beta-lactamase class C family)
MEQPGKVFGVAVIADQRIAWAQTRGCPPGTVFQAGSISKPVTALVALRLGLGLDEDVNDSLTSWSVPDSQRVTLRQLLGHTAGAGVSFFPGYRQDAAVPTLVQVLDGVPPARTAGVGAGVGAGPGGFRYSGGGYAIVQQLIIDVTGSPFASVARDLVLEPLGMVSSTFEQAPPGTPARPDWRIYPEAAAAGLWTTPEDLARFVCALQTGTDGAKPMLTPNARLPFRGQWRLLPLLGVRAPDSGGLGMFLRGDRFSHVGGAGGFLSVLTGSRADGSGAVVMVAENSVRFPFQVLRAISDAQGWTGCRVVDFKRRRGV